MRALGTTLLSTIHSTAFLVKVKVNGRTVADMSIVKHLTSAFIILIRLAVTVYIKACLGDIFVVSTGLTTITFLGTPRRVTLLVTISVRDMLLELKFILVVTFLGRPRTVTVAIKSSIPSRPVPRRILALVFTRWRRRGISPLIKPRYSVLVKTLVIATIGLKWSLHLSEGSTSFNIVVVSTMLVVKVSITLENSRETPPNIKLTMVLKMAVLLILVVASKIYATLYFFLY